MFQFLKKKKQGGTDQILESFICFMFILFIMIYMIFIINQFRINSELQRTTNEIASYLESTRTDLYSFEYTESSPELKDILETCGTEYVYNSIYTTSNPKKITVKNEYDDTTNTSLLTIEFTQNNKGTLSKLNKTLTKQIRVTYKR